MDQQERDGELVLQNVAWLLPPKKGFGTRPAGILRLSRDSVHFAPRTKPEYAFSIPLRELTCMVDPKNTVFALLNNWRFDPARTPRASKPATTHVCAHGCPRPAIVCQPQNGGWVCEKHRLSHDDDTTHASAPTPSALAPYNHGYCLMFTRHAFTFEYVPQSATDLLSDLPGLTADGVETGARIIGTATNPLLGIVGPFMNAVNRSRDARKNTALVKHWKSTVDEVLSGASDATGISPH